HPTIESMKVRYTKPIQYGSDSSSSTITKLVVDLGSNSLLSSILRPSITHLSMIVYRDTLNMDTLAKVPSLKRLGIYRYFNQQIEPGTLPSSITRLYLGISFNQPITPNSLPQSLTKLEFGWSYDQEFKVGSLPSSLKKLLMDVKYNQTFGVGVLPAKLKVLKLGLYYNRPFIPGALPTSLQQLTLLGTNYTHDLVGEGILPSSLLHLRVCTSFKQIAQLKSMALISLHWSGSDWDTSSQTLPMTMASSLRSLSLNFGFNQVIDNFLPAGITKLELGQDYSKPITPGSLPPTLTNLIFGSGFNHPIEPKTLPNSITDLKFGCYFNQPLTEDNLPTGLISLRLRRKFSFDLDWLPETLVNLEFSDMYQIRLVKCIGNTMARQSYHFESIKVIDLMQFRESFICRYDVDDNVDGLLTEVPAPMVIASDTLYIEMNPEDNDDCYDISTCQQYPTLGLICCVSFMLHLFPNVNVIEFQATSCIYRLRLIDNNTA
ncbi:hypothetical protein SAMD00019534_055920, partial [Acytostelium subglobosum LB1]|uniref:hypothetical protein n=1 Tax=Acytostelium subglobosum LB1 TaxID=1410327 RepID=UPI0006448081